MFDKKEGKEKRDMKEEREDKEEIMPFNNRINISYRDCLQVEVESGELNFAQLKMEALELLKIVKEHLVDSESEPNENEVA
jgi:hypothetical protein